MIAISGKTEYPVNSLILKNFQRLAEYGKIPRGTNKGHKDGWGIVAYEKGKPNLFVKSDKNAYIDSLFSETMKELKRKATDIVICHLRKASIGTKNIINAHPFVHYAYAFCQNGTIFDSEKIPLKPEFKKLVKGETDSEKFFAYILQFLNNDNESGARIIRLAIKNSVTSIRKNFDFTAVNIIFSNGKYVWGLREVNEKNRIVIEKKLMDYFSLFSGSGYDCDIISSEKILLKGLKWRSVNNHELLQINLKNHEIKSFFLP